MITIVHFETFLKRHRALRKFKREVFHRWAKNTDKDSVDKVYRKVMMKIQDWAWIEGPFIWMHTKDGQDYWAQMNGLWHKEIDKLKSKGGKS